MSGCVVTLVFSFLWCNELLLSSPLTVFLPLPPLALHWSHSTLLNVHLVQVWPDTLTARCLVTAPCQGPELLTSPVAPARVNGAATTRQPRCHHQAAKQKFLRQQGRVLCQQGRAETLCSSECWSCFRSVFKTPRFLQISKYSLLHCLTRPCLHA